MFHLSFVFIYDYWCPTQFPYHMMFMLFKIWRYLQTFLTVTQRNDTSGAGTAYLSGVPEFTSVFSWVRVVLSFGFWVVFCRLLFIFLAHLAKSNELGVCRPSSVNFSHFNLLL